MPAPIIPWQSSNIPSEIQAELNRRKTNRSFKYIGGQTANWSKDGDWNTYKGPMVSWIRVCSNSAGHPDVPVQLDQNGNPICSNQRFVLYSGKGFYDTYGFAPPKNVGGARQQIIGYTPGDYENADFGKPHIIENSLKAPAGEISNYPIHVPSPEISRLEVTVQKELLRRVQIEWVCFSWKQLVYMTPYFLVPGITCMVEWGWNHYNAQSLVNLGDVNKMQNLWDNAYPLYFDNIIKSNGNYDVIYGIITNFNWSIEGNKIICTTEITSKDRLYTGIAKDYGLSVVNEDDTSKNGIFKSIRDFLKDDDVIINLKSLVTSTPVVNSSALGLIKYNPKNGVWYDILNPLLTKGTPEQIGMRLPHVFGVFAGRPSGPNLQDDSYTHNEMFGTPKDGDFDKKIKDNDPNNFWINMGMVVAILNHYSAVPSGTKNGNKSFEVDIQNTVISGHPNLVSCDSRVLVPNYQAPKFLYGSVGLIDNADNISTPDPSRPYSYQVLRPINVGDNPQNIQLRDILYQPSGKGQKSGSCYRDDLDEVINYNRYRYVEITSDVKYPLTSFSFPSQFTSDVPLPVSPRGLAGNKLEKDWSGLLSNVYIAFSVLKDAVEDENNASYPDIYRAILQVLMDSVDGFWDLALVEVDGVLTITDKKFVGKYALDAQQDTVYSFDYGDADSIIKSLKFRPVLSDAQATRTIYGSTNNKTAKYQYIDKNDLLDYMFRDAVIGTPEDKSQPDDDLSRRQTANEQQRDLVRTVQTINSKSDDGSLQMSLNAYRRFDNPPAGTPKDMPEIIKLVMPCQQLLRLLLADNDVDNNPRYCAVQPGIILELTLQGIGGLRTFQYFLVRNLPEPYSDRNIIFRITDVHQTLEAGNWETTIRAQPIPLRGYIKTRLKGPYINNQNTINGWLPDSLTNTKTN
jgi:hypothetical protein